MPALTYPAAAARRTAYPPRRSRSSGSRRGKGLLQHLLVPALHGALPLPQVHHIAVGVCQHLHFYVARPRRPFEIDGGVAEGSWASRRALRRACGRSAPAPRAGSPPPPPAAFTGGGTRSPPQRRGWARPRRPGLRSRPAPAPPGSGRGPAPGACPPGGAWPPAGTDEGDPAPAQAAARSGFSEREAVAGVQGVGPGAAGGVDDGFDVQVAGDGQGEGGARTWRAPPSSGPWTATPVIPISAQACRTRTAISPRLATRRRSNIEPRRDPGGRPGGRSRAAREPFLPFRAGAPGGQGLRGQARRASGGPWLARRTWRMRAGGPGSRPRSARAGRHLRRHQGRPGAPRRAAVPSAGHGWPRRARR